MMGLDELAELHMRGLADAAAGKFDPIEPKNVMKPLGFKPHATLPDSVREQLAKHGPGATLFVHPLLKSRIAGLEVFRRNLKLVSFSWPADWKKWRRRTLGNRLFSDSVGALFRALGFGRTHVAIVPTGWPTSWFRGSTLFEITTEGYLIREPRPLSTITKACKVFLRGISLAFSLARKSPGIRTFVQPPAPKASSQLEPKPG
jgi:hypothetical protein